MVMKILENEWYVVVKAYKLAVFEIFRDFFVLPYIAFLCYPYVHIESTDSMICSNIAIRHSAIQFNTFRHINILRTAIYCSILHVLCKPELNHRNVNVDKLLFLCENLRQLTFL